MEVSERRWRETAPPPRPEAPGPDPVRLQLFLVESSVADAQRALARARRHASGRYRDQLVCLEDIVILLGRELLEEANGDR